MLQRETGVHATPKGDFSNREGWKSFCSGTESHMEVKIILECSYFTFVMCLSLIKEERQ